MNWPLAIVIIVAITAFAKVMTAKYRAQAGIIEDEDGNQKLVKSTEDSFAKRDIEELRERIKVLERIATDANTTESLNVSKISHEIESLRHQ